MPDNDRKVIRQIISNIPDEIETIDVSFQVQIREHIIESNLFQELTEPDKALELTKTIDFGLNVAKMEIAKTINDTFEFGKKHC